MEYGTDWPSDRFAEMAKKLYDKARFEDALAVVKGGLRLFPVDEQLLMGEGLCRVRLGDFAQARKILSNLLAKYPSDPQVVYLLVETHLSLGRPGPAWELAQRIFKDPDPMSLCGVGHLFNNHNRPHEARECFAQAVRLDPCMAEAFLGLAICCFSAERNEAGFAMLQKAIWHDPECYCALDLLGDVCFESDEKDLALTFWERIPLSRHTGSDTLKKYLELALARYPAGHPWPKKIKRRLARVSKTAPTGIKEMLDAVAPGPCGKRK